VGEVVLFALMFCCLTIVVGVMLRISLLFGVFVNLGLCHFWRMLCGIVARMASKTVLCNTTLIFKFGV
jgi:hypothetical protein